MSGFLLSLLLCYLGAGMVQAQPIPQNIILMIGDGMGLAQISASLLVDGKLHMSDLPVGGFMQTQSANDWITDSAASATALATGHKTVNGRISISPEGDTLKTVIEFAQEKKMSTGLVVTCRVTHATPAAFISHVNQRKQYSDIADQLSVAGLSVLFGYGLGDFIPAGATGSLRKDQQDLRPQLRASFENLAFSPAQFDQLGSGSAVALLELDHPDKAPRPGPDLSQLSTRALEILSENPDGFFLMIEGSQIDWSGHANDSDWLLKEMRDFDRAVGVAVDFARTHPETLLLVTADHETGGFCLTGHSHAGDIRNGAKYCTDHHTATMVPLLAMGPVAGDFGGIQDIAGVGRRLIELVRAH